MLKLEVMSLDTSDNLILILQSTDEMRQPYETMLEPLGIQLKWYSEFSKLISTENETQPAAILLDLDCLSVSFDGELEQLRSLYPECDFIAFSASDSSQLALQCIRSGFSDFLLKPATPEELSYCLKKILQKKDFIARLSDSRSGLLRAVSQIANCATPTLTRLYTVEHLVKATGAAGGAWVSLANSQGIPTKILCAYPKKVDVTQAIKKLNPFIKSEIPKQIKKLKNKKTGKKSLYIPCQEPAGSAILLWDVLATMSPKKISDIKVISEQSQLSLLNIQRFEEVKKQNFIDDLTGLYNSRYLKFALTSCIQKCKLPHQVFSVLFIDVDHFKSVNDKYTHLVGSEFLVTIGKTIKNAVRKIDPVFRYGGDEFVVILNDANTEGAVVIAERIRKNIERRVFVIQGRQIQSTVSIGVASFPTHAKERETLLQLADEAMYAAKRQTRNSVHLAVPEKDSLSLPKKNEKSF